MACVHTIVVLFSAFRKMIPWIALGLLLYLGGKMILEGIQERNSGSDGGEGACLSGKDLLLQGIATSIDALSVGLTIVDYGFPFALVESLIIGVVTFLICMGGLRIGKRFGTILAGKASVLGGLILIAIGVEIFLKSLLG